MTDKQSNDFELYKICINAIFELKKMYLQIATGLATANIATVAVGVGKKNLHYLLLLSLVFLFLIYHFYRKMVINIKPIHDVITKIEKELKKKRLVSESVYQHYSNLVYDTKGNGIHHKQTFFALLIIAIIELLLYFYKAGFFVSL